MGSRYCECGVNWILKTYGILLYQVVTQGSYCTAQGMSDLDQVIIARARLMVIDQGTLKQIGDVGVALT